MGRIKKKMEEICPDYPAILLFLLKLGRDGNPLEEK
jgi:hypothetical protein